MEIKASVHTENMEKVSIYVSKQHVILMNKPCKTVMIHGLTGRQRVCLFAMHWYFSFCLLFDPTFKNPNFPGGNTCGQMNPAPYMMLLASEGSTSGGIRCSVNIMVKLLKKANMKT